MVFRVEYLDLCRWDVARFSETRAAGECMFHACPKVEQHPKCLDHTVLHVIGTQDMLFISGRIIYLYILQRLDAHHATLIKGPDHAQPE